MSREIISVYAFRSPLKGVVEYPVVNVAAAANGSEQQSLITLGNELVQVRVDVIANMRRNRHHAGVLVALGAVDTAPLRFCSTTFVGALGSVRCVTARVTVSTLQSLLRSFRRSSDTSPKRRPHHAASNTKALHCAVLSSAPSLSAIVCSSTVEAMGTFRFGLALWP